MFNWLSLVAGVISAAAGILAFREQFQYALPATAYVQPAPGNAVASDVAAEAAVGPDQQARSPGDNPSVVAEFVSDGIQLSGRVPDAGSRDRLLARAREMYGSARVIDTIVIDDNVSQAAWLASDLLFAVLPARGARRTEMDGEHLTLSGVVPQQEIGDLIADEAQQQVGDDIRVVSRLVVRAASAVESQIARFLRLSNVEFLTNSTNFTRRGLKRLQRIANLLKANMYDRFMIAGHTDSRGDAAANMTLSEARAHAVLRYLIEDGLPGDRFVARGFGETQPIADNATAEGRQRNRRIEFMQLDGTEQ
jgi:OOP family OmpA-OmpF porin